MNKNIDPASLFNIGYGLYVITSNDGNRHNGLVVNAVMQVTSAPCRVAVAISKQNYSHDVIKSTGIMNVNCLSQDAPFELFKTFGFASGRDTDKFEGKTLSLSENGLVFLDKYINSYISLKVESYTDLDTHGLFICSVTEAVRVSDAETMTYTYYHKNVKPKPEAAPEKKKGYVCKICGYVYEGDPLPDDFVCPWCKHGAEDFEPLN